MNQPSRTSADHSYTRMLGYLPQASSRASSQASRLDAEYGPSERIDFTSTQSTGSPAATSIISAMRSSQPVGEPTATLAASLVPRASTQQPSKPRSCHLVATS